MTMSARKAKRRIVDMMASTVLVQLRFLARDVEGQRVLDWLKRPGRAANVLRRELRRQGRQS